MRTSLNPGEIQAALTLLETLLLRIEDWQSTIENQPLAPEVEAQLASFSAQGKEIIQTLLPKLDRSEVIRRLRTNVMGAATKTEVPYHLRVITEIFGEEVAARV